MLLHILHWRFFSPKNDIRALMNTFVAIPLICITVLFFLGLQFFELDLWPIRVIELIAILVMHLAFSGVYISSYPAAQANSPTLQILLMFRHHPKKGVTAASIYKAFDYTAILHVRLQDLLDTQLLKKSGNGYILTPFGRVSITFFVLYRKLLGLGLKGG